MGEDDRLVGRKQRVEIVAGQPVRMLFMWLQIVEGKSFRLADEVRYIQRRAADYDSRIVTIGQLILFSTKTGDAWLLDGPVAKRRRSAGAQSVPRHPDRHAGRFRAGHRTLIVMGNPMNDFISEDDLLSFEGWLRYQGADPAAMTPEQLTEWQGMFDDVMERRKTSPKVGLMKLQRVPGEQKYAVAIRDGSKLWLTLWVRCSRKGEIFVMYPRPDRDWDAHASYHLDGTLHQKSYGHVGISVKRQPLTEAFRGSEHLGLYRNHSAVGPTARH
jgi:hypothetical protein